MVSNTFSQAYMASVFLTKNLQVFANISEKNDPNFMLTSTLIYYAPLLLLFFSVAGFVGNLLVCLAIKLDSRLQSATNYYLFSLAIVDMLVSIIVIPLATIQILNGMFY